MSGSVLLTDSSDTTIAEAARLLPGWIIDVRDPGTLSDALESIQGLRAIVLTTTDPVIIRSTVEAAHSKHIPVVMGCPDETARRRAVELHVEEWYSAPASREEIASRVRSAVGRTSVNGTAAADRAERVEYEEMLHDALTGLPTLPVMIERTRSLIKERGEFVILYLNFVRYTKIEEIYGWEKLDEVLETTVIAVREFLDQNRFRSTRMMVSFTNDDDFIFFHVPAAGVSPASDSDIMDLTTRLQQHVASRLESEHGEDIAALVDMYIGHSHVYYNPKIRLERLIYRGIREAANAAKGTADRERGRKVSDLKATIHDRGVYVDYHPIVSAESGLVIGYEALARGVMRSLRSPEVMFEVAAEADLVWELSRLCRSRALEGARTRLLKGQLLFLNVDPHDFADPSFGEMGSLDPGCVVIEITERTAIKDYPKFSERLRVFRERGYRFAVDDAGSGYAGLGSIANLAPDFIKLDISLINSIDTNFIKQNLVETMVRFAEDQGAQVIAEGIERAEELETVKRLGVHLLQGFFLHRPGRIAPAVAGA